MIIEDLRLEAVSHVIDFELEEEYNNISKHHSTNINLGDLEICWRWTSFVICKSL